MKSIQCLSFLLECLWPDIIGNEWEWQQDCWHDSYNNALDEGNAWIQDGDCNHRLLRGGSWNNEPSRVRSAGRFRHLCESW